MRPRVWRSDRSVGLAQLGFDDRGLTGPGPGLCVLEVLLAMAAGGVAFQIGTSDGAATAVAHAVAAFAEALEGLVDPVEHGRGSGQFGLVAFLHERRI